MGTAPCRIEDIEIEKDAAQAIGERADILRERDEEPVGQLVGSSREPRVEKGFVEESRRRSIRLQTDQPAASPPRRVVQDCDWVLRRAVADACPAQLAHRAFAQAVAENT